MWPALASAQTASFETLSNTRLPLFGNLVKAFKRDLKVLLSSEQNGCPIMQNVNVLP